MDHWNRLMRLSPAKTRITTEMNYALAWCEEGGAKGCFKRKNYHLWSGYLYLTGIIKIYI